MRFWCFFLEQIIIKCCREDFFKDSVAWKILIEILFFPFQDDAKKLEDSWDWDTEKSSKASSDQYVKVQASVDSDDSSGGELVNIPLEIGVAEKNFEKLQEEKSALQSKVFDLEKENAQLNKGLEELDTQHTEALQQMLQIKEEIQRELNATKVGFIHGMVSERVD